MSPIPFQIDDFALPVTPAKAVERNGVVCCGFLLVSVIGLGHRREDFMGEHGNS